MTALNNYLEEFKSGKGEEYTHTKIGDKPSQIYGGVYNITDEDKFMKTYQKEVEDNKKLYLTEKQLSGEQKRLYVDIDLRYNSDVSDRQHTPEHIIDLIYIYLKYIEKLCVIEDGYKIDVYVMEKADINKLENKTKDGIHLCFGICMKSIVQEELRIMVLKELENVWSDLPLTCDWTDVIDEGIVKGNCNCQMYGSRKPNNEPYQISSYYLYTWKANNQDWVGGPSPYKKIDYKKISVRNKNIQIGKLKDDINLTVQDKVKKKVDVIENVIINNKNKITAENIEIAELMSVETYLTPFAEWIKTMWALKNAGFDLDFAIKLSKKAEDKYDQDKLLEIWNDTKDGVGMGTIYHQAKESNEEKYLAIKIKYFPKDIYKSEEATLAETLLLVFGDNLVYYNGIIMIYTNDKWYEDDKLDLLKCMISREGKKYYSQKLAILYKYSSFIDESDALYEPLKRKINQLTDISIFILKTNWKTNIAKEIKALIMDKHEKIDFNADGNVIAFNNKKYNFNTKAFEDILKKEYISFSTGYDWIEPTSDEVDIIKTLVEQIFPNLDRRKCYLSVMREALIGCVKQNFTIANGCGGNGKGVLDDLLMFCLGDDYGYSGNISVLVDKIKDGPNPSVANLHKKRFVLFKEPNDKDKIQLGNIKLLVDNDCCNARGLYKTADKTILLATFILECNKRLKFSGDVDLAEYRRFIDVEFEATFTLDEELLNDKNLQNVYKANKEYKQLAFKKAHACALFKYLIDNAEEQITIPAIVKARTKEYVDSNDTLLTWTENKYIYDKSEVKEKEKIKLKYIKVSDMFCEYLSSEEYDKLHKAQRPTKKEFIKLIRENKTLKMSFKERHGDIRNVLLGWRLLNKSELLDRGIEEEDDDE